MMAKRERNQCLNLRFTDKEKKAIITLAKKEGKTYTQLILDKVLKDEKIEVKK